MFLSISICASIMVPMWGHEASGAGGRIDSLTSQQWTTCPSVNTPPTSHQSSFFPLCVLSMCVLMLPAWGGCICAVVANRGRCEHWLSDVRLCSASAEECSTTELARPQGRAGSLVSGQSRSQQQAHQAATAGWAVTSWHFESVCVSFLTFWYSRWHQPRENHISKQSIHWMI